MTRTNTLSTMPREAKLQKFIDFLCEFKKSNCTTISPN